MRNFETTLIFFHPVNSEFRFSTGRATEQTLLFLPAFSRGVYSIHETPPTSPTGCFTRGTLRNFSFVRVFLSSLLFSDILRCNYNANSTERNPNFTSNSPM